MEGATKISLFSRSLNHGSGLRGPIYDFTYLEALMDRRSYMSLCVAQYE